MQIVPIKDLKDTAGIEKRCEKGPVFVTKNGYGRLVIMDIDYFEKRLASTDEADFINRGLMDYEAGKIQDGKKAIEAVRSRYGI